MFDRDKLNLAFRNKVIEVEERKQDEKVSNQEKVENEEFLAETQESDSNRQMLDAVISNLTDPQKRKSSSDKKPDVYEAYQIILSEHFKKTKPQKRRASISIARPKKYEPNLISAPKTNNTRLRKQSTDNVKTLSKDFEKVQLINNKPGKTNVP